VWLPVTLGWRGLGLVFRVEAVRVVFSVRRRLALRAWPGVVAGKLVYDALSGVGVFLEQGGGFRVSPVREAESGRVPVGALLPGQRYVVEAVFWSGVGAGEVAIALGHAPGWVEVEEAEVRTVEASAPEPLGWGEAVEALRRGAGDRVAAVYEVLHGPTFYRHYGGEVVYPSPHRMWPSVLRRLSQALAAGGGEAPDYRPLGLLLQQSTELALDQTKKFRLLISHGKRQRVFQGRARYRVAAPPRLLEAAEALLEAARLLGLGGSPGLGLGGVEEARRLEEPGETGGDEGDTLWG